MTERPRSFCCHEAGHAVVLWSFGVFVAAVWVTYTEQKGWHGGTDIVPGSADHLSLIDQIAICSAGIAAEQAFECLTHEFGSAMDHVKIIELFEANEISEEEQGIALRDAGYDRARAILETHKHKVLKLVERLVECGQVDASEFERLMDAEMTPRIC